MDLVDCVSDWAATAFGTTAKTEPNFHKVTFMFDFCGQKNFERANAAVEVTTTLRFP